MTKPAQRCAPRSCSATARNLLQRFEPKAVCALAGYARELYDRILANDFTQATNFLNSYIDSLSACREQDIPQIREALASIAYWLSRQGKQNEQDGSQYISEFIHFAPSLSGRARLSARTAAKAHRQHLEPR